MEVQDLGLNSVDIVNSQTCPRVLVGDSMQSIYSFRNCINGFDVFDFTKLFLTTSYRSNQRIVNLSSYVAKHAALFGEDVKVGRGLGTSLNNTTCYIGHTNYYVLKKKALQPELTVVGDYDWPTVFSKLDDLINLKDNRKDLIKNKFLCYFNDLHHFYVDCENKRDFEWIGLIRFASEGRSMFHRLKMAVTQSTDNTLFVSNVHKSKGLEWNKVILDDGFLSPDQITAVNKSDYNNREELNKLYVAVTRAMTEVELPKDFLVSTYVMSDIQKAINGKVW